MFELDIEKPVRSCARFIPKAVIDECALRWEE
jgi:hypothetical protein